MDIFEEVNKLSVAGIHEFCIKEYDGVNLVLIGSFDLHYGHDVEIIFSDVAYINLPTQFLEPRFRFGTTEEGKNYPDIMDDDVLLYCIETGAASQNEDLIDRYYVIAETVKVTII